MKKIIVLFLLCLSMQSICDDKQIVIKKDNIIQYMFVDSNDHNLYYKIVRNGEDKYLIIKRAITSNKYAYLIQNDVSLNEVLHFLKTKNVIVVNKKEASFIYKETLQELKQEDITNE